jgi:long-chain acyl-CoA synthetase
MERVRQFIILGRPFQIETGELTPTHKVRRHHVLTKYRDQLDALYAGNAGAEELPRSGSSAR